MKKKVLLGLILAVLLPLTGCGSSSDSGTKYNFDFDETQMVQQTEAIASQFASVSDAESKYYANSTEESDNVGKTAIEGFRQAHDTDHVGQFLGYFDTAGDNLSIENGNKGNVLCAVVAKYQNRDVKVQVSYKKNYQYDMQADQVRSQIESLAASQGVDPDTYAVQTGTQMGINAVSVDDFISQYLSGNGITPLTAEECEVTAIYTKGELLEKAAGNTAIGMGTVFVVLIFISFIISLLKYVPKLFGQDEGTGNKKNEKKQASAASASAVSASPAAVAAETDDDELYAVITAAVLAAQQEKGPVHTDSKDKLVVRSIRRVR